MKKLLMVSLLLLVGGFAVYPLSSQALTLPERLRGRILLQVQSQGEAWYVNPATMQRYYLGRPNDAFIIMKKFGSGISNASFAAIRIKAPSRLAGKILIKVQDGGKAYYINPPDLKPYYLGRPADAFNIMRSVSLGVFNDTLAQIPIAADSKPVPVINYNPSSTAQSDSIIYINSYSFSPQTITVKAGSKIIWINKDNVFHSVADAPYFDSGNIAANGLYWIELTTKGTYDYHCAFHPSMTGRIIVQ
jgi:plastocyanin